VATTKARIRLMIYDGARQPFSKRQSPLLRVHNGTSIDPVTKTVNMKSEAQGVVFLDVDYFDNFADNYSVVVSADGYRDAGFFPVKVSPKVLADLSIMLIPTNPSFAFDPWETLAASHPRTAQFLSLTPVGPSVDDNYASSIEDHPKETACLLNLATAMSQLFLANGTPLDYFRSIEWATLAQDRFFGYAIPTLVSEVKAAASRGALRPRSTPRCSTGMRPPVSRRSALGKRMSNLRFTKTTRKRSAQTPVSGLSRTSTITGTLPRMRSWRFSTTRLRTHSRILRRSTCFAG
jgi:hypothetical protein